MIVDHVWFFVLPEWWWMRAIGRFAMPIFLFLVWINGFYRWSRWLLWAAVAAQVLWSFVFWITFGEIGILNILVVIMAVRWLLAGMDYVRNHHQWFWWVVCLLIVLLVSVHPLLVEVFDYGSYGILWGVCGYVVARGFTPVVTGVVISILYIAFLVYQYQVFGGSFAPVRWWWIMIGSIGVGWLLWRTASRNDSLLSWCAWFDRLMIFVSTHALRIYIYHIVFLFLVAML